MTLEIKKCILQNLENDPGKNTKNCLEMDWNEKK